MASCGNASRVLLKATMEAFKCVQVFMRTILAAVDAVVFALLIQNAALLEQGSPFGVKSSLGESLIVAEDVRDGALGPLSSAVPLWHTTSPPLLRVFHKVLRRLFAVRY